MKRIRDAQTIIGILEGGALAPALSKEITETLSELNDHSTDNPRKKIKGSVTLKLDVEVEAGAATIHADISSKRPKAVRGSSFFWLLEDGALSTEHPQQMNMFGPRDSDRDVAEG